TTGSPSRISSAPRTSKPRQAGWAKLVAPLEEMTPSAEGGAGVSSPTPRRPARLVQRRTRDGGERDAGEVEHGVQRLGHGVDGHLGALGDQAGRLHQPVDQEALHRVKDGGVVAGGAGGAADDDPL